MSIRNSWRHFHLITSHKYHVARYCFKCGLYKQGLLHDLSKYALVEFKTGIRYYNGTKSPNGVERKENGYSLAWLHHKGRNRHHWEFWVDFTGDGTVASKMPEVYVIEMFIDRVCASMVYNKGNFSSQDPLKYYLRTKEYCIFHPETEALLVELLEHLAQNDIEATLEYIKKGYLK